MLAGQPRGCQSDFSCSRVNREAAKAIFLARGTTARLSKGFFSLAGQPRGCQDGFSCSRANRETAKTVFLARGSTARTSGGGRPCFLVRLLFIMFHVCIIV